MLHGLAIMHHAGARAAHCQWEGRLACIRERRGRAEQHPVHVLHRAQLVHLGEHGLRRCCRDRVSRVAKTLHQPAMILEAGQPARTAAPLIDC